MTGVVSSRGPRWPRYNSFSPRQVIVRVVRCDNVATEIVWRAISVKSADPLGFPRYGPGMVEYGPLVSTTRLDVRPHNAQRPALFSAITASSDQVGNMEACDK